MYIVPRTSYELQGTFVYPCMMYDLELGAEKDVEVVDPLDPTRKRTIHDAYYRDLLVPIFKRGKKVYSSPPLIEIQENTRKELETLCSTVRRFLNPDPYFVGLESKIYDLKMKLINEIKNR